MQINNDARWLKRLQLRHKQAAAIDNGIASLLNYNKCSKLSKEEYELLKLNTKEIIRIGEIKLPAYLAFLSVITSRFTWKDSNGKKISWKWLVLVPWI